ncbi:MAG: hypothetical protein H6510_02005 [Acidobacteria bacterium]|nr:hypothetical protein [Acidobacteriota bacterium]MCB9396566.1 hypothetical protein [Acidobacteriota bacterium]
MDQRFSRGSQSVAKRKLRGLELFWLFLFAFLLALPMLWVASVQTNLIEFGYKVQALRAKESELLEEQDRLKAELAFLKRPDRVFTELQKQGLTPSPERIQVYEGQEVLMAEMPQAGATREQ